MSKALSILENTLLIFGAAIMCIITFVNVVSRYITGTSFSFTEEITINILVLVVFVGASVGVRNGAHLGFTLIFDRANLPFKKILCIFTGLIVVSIFGLFTYYGIDMFLYQMSINQMTPALGWPQWIYSAGFALGCLLCVIRTIEASVKEYKNLQLESE
ncbi:TRAP transporter small permease [Cytobacillus kochii]|uniref:TRAP transporter small permease n=1 Tax=Cytobacillus kochii TaxID=859143 RepID=UPI0020403450|nr:TRAP transporter small permease [Cytobacillus kochii]MCM3323563.1 TRAP transporter small permease [Cytobacillus kochii]MCM3345958.1 TRAP transporter small permease [Cytobacillus kochii]